MSNFSRFFKSEHAATAAGDMVSLPVSALLGVNPERAELLATLGIETVFDLARSRLFDHAVQVLELAESEASTRPNDLLTPGFVLPLSATIADLTLAHLRGLSGAQSESIVELLQTPTIRELALWPPYRAALTLLKRDSGADTDDQEDAAAARLRPEFGSYATERNYYTTLVMIGST